MEVHYYAPYESDSSKSGSGSEADSDSETELSEDELSFEDTAARRLDNDYRYALVKAGGPNFNTLNEQLAFTKDNIGSAYSNELVADQTLQPSEVNPIYKQPKKQILSSLFSFKSDDRDKTVYPFSTYFTIKTPRVYKNVTQIQLVQINIQIPTSSIPDVSSLEAKIIEVIGKKFDISDCSNCFSSQSQTSSSINSIGIAEFGRQNPIQPDQILVHNIRARPGIYDPVTLIDELDKQANKTPPFTTVSYAEHRRLFMSTKTVDHLFNEPGRYYENKLTGNFFATNNKSDIISLYLPNLTIQNSSNPSEQETFVAYFFPVLREAFQTPFDSKFLDFGGETERVAAKRVLYTFEGLGSAYYYHLCQLNRQYLTTLRRAYTFEYHPINDYEWDIEPGTNRIVARHANLHKSIQTDIAKRYAYDIQQENAKAGVTSQILQRQLQTEAVVTDLKHQVDLALVQMGVPYSLYSTSYLYTSTNLLSTTVLSALPTEQQSATDKHLFNLATGTTFAPPVGPPVGSGSYGWNSLQTIIGDLATHGDLPASTDYISSIIKTNTASIITKAGGNAIPGFGGVPVQATDFPSLYSTFVNYQSTNTGLSQNITTASLAAKTATKNYVNSRYSTVFPSFLLNNDAVPTNAGTGGVTWYAGLHIYKPSSPFDYPGTTGSIKTTDALFNIGPFVNSVNDPQSNACCQLITNYLIGLYGCIPTNFYINSMFYKMGFGIKNFISFYSTVGLSNALKNDNIYITINTEQTMNRMDVSRPQNITVTQETTGEYNTVLGKILTEGTGVQTSTQAIVQSPARFNPPLANMDHVTFQLLLDDLTPFNLVVPFEIPNSAWNGILQIDQELGIIENNI